MRCKTLVHERSQPTPKPLKSHNVEESGASGDVSPQECGLRVGGVGATQAIPMGIGLRV